MGRLDGRVVLISGASRGFGRATALLCAREGADLVLNYRAAEAEAESLADKVQAMGRRAEVVRADVGDPVQVGALAERAIAAFGRVDVLVNNAGVMEVRRFVEQDPEVVRWMLEVNIGGTLALTRAILPGMIERGSGRVICLASQLGHVGGENFGVYSGTKGFVLAFVKSLAREVGQRGVTVNAVCPGSIVTDMNRGVYPTPERQAARAQELPLRRLGEPSDVAESVVFLAAESGRFITGQCVDVNGGATMA